MIINFNRLAKNTMEEMASKSMPTGTVIGIMLIVAIVFGTGAYLYANNKATIEKENLNAQITALQQEVSDMNQVAANESLTTAPTNWKTYQDQKMGYQLQYPNDWDNAQDNSSETNPYNIIIWNKDRSGQIQITNVTNTFSNDTDGSIKDVESVIKDLNGGKYEKIVVSGSDGYYTVNESPAGGYILGIHLVKNKEVLYMDYTYDSSKTSLPEAEKLFKQIIGTFKFN